MSKQLEEQIYRLAGVRFNLRSPQQLAEVLFRRLQLPKPKRMAGGRLSTAAPILEALAKEHEIGASFCSSENWKNCGALSWMGC